MQQTTLLPLSLAANQPADRFYRGGPRIAAFRGAGAAGDHVPEDWVGSATALFGEAELGRTVLPDGRSLAVHLAEDPVGWLGATHAERWGSDPGLLVKLLDAGERLPVHVHPDRAFAAEHLGLGHGKTEAWILLEPATVHLGFRRAVERPELERWVAGQESEAMLDAMHTLAVAAGEAVLVPAGMPHAIGAGAFLVELQEPTDLSILLEWAGFTIDGVRDGHLGLGFDAALGAVDARRWDEAAIDGLRTPAGATGALFPGAEDYFRGERIVVQGSARLDEGFSILVVTQGEGVLRAGDADVALARGCTILLPHSVGPAQVHGVLELLRCRPPAA